MTAPFKLTAKQQQLAPLLQSVARHCLIYGGARSGKTFLFCYAIATRALVANQSRHGIFRRHGVAVKQSIGSDTWPKMMALAYPNAVWKYYEQDGLIEFSNGSEVWLAGLDDKERVDKILGKEFLTTYENEASEIGYDTHLTLMSRLAQKVERTIGEPGIMAQKCYTDLNPTKRSHWTYKLWVDGIEPTSRTPVDRTQYVYGLANPADNAENLTEEYLQALENLPKAQRDRFWVGQYSGDNPDALWIRETINSNRLILRPGHNPPIMKRIVIAVDPAVSKNDASDETGIIAAGVDEHNIGYVLADASGKYAPNDWAKVALSLYASYEANALVAEVNQGGDMVASVIAAVNPNVAVKQVRATRGKFVRAEPIAALYARGSIRHVGTFEELEDQQTSFVSDDNRTVSGSSPDRVDALVWAFTELFPNLIADRIKPHNQTVADGTYDPFRPQDLGRGSGGRQRQATAGIDDYRPF